MSLTAEADRITQSYRAAQTRVAALATVAMDQVWPLLDPTNVDGTSARWLVATQAIVQSRRTLSTRLAARYMVLHKQAELGPGAEPPPVQLAPPVENARLATSLLVTGPFAVREALAGGVSLAEAMDAARAQSAGAAIRHTLNGGRDTITATVQADRDAVGWFRRCRGDACAFCAMLASRGPVYKQETASFQPHDTCYCTPEPAYSRDTPWPDESVRFKELWDEAQREAAESGDLQRGTKNDALNAFRRALTAASSAAG